MDKQKLRKNGKLAQISSSKKKQLAKDSPGRRVDRFAGDPGGAPDVDVRNEFQHDRDRILYSDAFKRLACITQVAGANEGHLFHNRLTHSLKVAQVARRLAEKLCGANSSLEKDLNADVCEAAALAHDLGHPPFGHIAEQKLDQLAKNAGLTDGFEGNAQTFRILTRLAAHKEAYRGMNLTRATLGAVLKYPWMRSRTGNHSSKFGAYDDDSEIFHFARDGLSKEEQTLEASVMDLADELTYSVHDLEDFYRAGLIPIDRLSNISDPLIQVVMDRWEKRLGTTKAHAHFKNKKNLESACDFLSFASTSGAFPGSYEQLVVLSRFRSLAITKFLDAAYVSDEARVCIPQDLQYLLAFLKQLIWCFVILNPRLATQQLGQTKVIERLFAEYFNALSNGRGRVERVPARFVRDAESVVSIKDHGQRGRQSARLAIDIVASLTEQEALALDARMSGVNAGSVGDLVV